MIVPCVYSIKVPAIIAPSVKADIQGECDHPCIRIEVFKLIYCTRNYIDSKFKIHSLQENIQCFTLCMFEEFHWCKQPACLQIRTIPKEGVYKC